MIRINRFAGNVTGWLLGLTLPAPPLPHAARRLGWPLIIVVAGLLLAWLPLRLAVAVMAGALFFTVALLQPSLALLALIPVIPFSSLLALPLGGVNAGAMELLLLLAIALWGIKILTSPTVYGRETTITTGPLLLPFVLLLGGITLSWLNTLSIRASLIETIKWVEAFALYLFILNLLPRRYIKWAVLAVLLSGMAQAALGLYQFIFKVGPEGFLLFGGDFLRAYGTFAQPNPYAGYLGLVLPLALSLLIWAAQPGQHGDAPAWPWPLNYRLWRVAIFAVPPALMLAALFASQSRGAWLGFAGAALITVVVRSQKAALSVASLLALLAIAGLVNSFEVSLAGPGDSTSLIGAVTGRFANAADIFEVTDVATTPVTDANFATVERLAHWQAAREMWRDNLWLGVGFGNYAVIYPAYAVGRWLDPLGHAHNYLLNLGAETGLAGIISYTIFWIWVFTVSFLAVRRSNGFFRAVAAGAMGIFTHLHIHNMVDNLYVQGMYLHVAIVIGLTSIIFTMQKNTQNIETGQRQ